MFVAKVIATTGLALFVGGAAGSLPSGAVAVGCVLFLLAAVIAAVVMEGRDLERVTALVPADLRDVQATPAPVPAEPVAA